MGDVKQLWKEIMEPSEEFTPVPFWFFNDEPDETKIRLQLEDFVEKGVNAFVLHPRIGIPETIPYLSPAYFETVRFIVKTASEIGMKVVLYDEGMYPSGSAHGMVAEENPEYASKGITLAEEPGDQEILARMPDGKYLIYGFTGGTIRGIHFGEDDGENGAPKSADILNPEAVQTFIRLTHERYYRELKEYFGTTIIGFFTDEPCALGRNASAYREWAKGMEKEIVLEGGKLIELEVLFEGLENKTTRIYRKLVKLHLRETFYKPLSDWCQDHGIAFMGHPAESDDIEEELYFHVPGQDLILRRVVPMTGGLSGKDSVQAKLAADIARLLGCRRNMNECFGVCGRGQIPWHFTGEDMKWYIDWLGIRGVNLFVPHAFYYSVMGKRKEERPPDVGPNNIWWPHYRHFSDYIKRISWLMTDGEDCASVAVLCDNNLVPAEEVAVLYENQIGFHYLPVSMVKGGREEDGTFRIGDCRYEIILNVLGKSYESQQELRNIRMVYSAAEILKLVKLEEYKTFRTVTLSSDARSLRAVRRMKGDQELIFLSNEGKNLVQTRLLAVNMENPVWIDLWEGKVYGCSYTLDSENKKWIDVTINPCETALILSDSEGVLTDVMSRRTKIEDWTERFELRTQEGNRRIYGCTVERDESLAVPDSFRVSGEEMAECWCNGELTGVSFWNPHTFHIGTKLKEGRNDIEVIMTGNASNIYTDHNVFFGLSVE
ncbi:hypothetical protein DFR60_10879 [Hungatella effluvii]|uniref:Alpha-L-rhamnosidase-like protein n=1 Tax=Hungatella effluvii TaxID=1096246 RepID=A0A2V3Y1Z7_9FIRM|nr:hypothetical protein [Hungatella effluvii]PXX51994.1 hypothetical protein DFR60_10879 [Hungatella effluvii]